ncbi:metallophosphoesterase [uncultured Shewanella sp.]|uniref:metallophosphoesterase n=1 Tax=uncultured Shewanella sp. TaxID=173975 RepID=UPI0026278F6A|nr:metallophosphoesterase [uncultured Shewanella sp.]
MASKPAEFSFRRVYYAGKLLQVYGYLGVMYVDDENIRDKYQQRWQLSLTAYPKEDPKENAEEKRKKQEKNLKKQEKNLKKAWLYEADFDKDIETQIRNNERNFSIDDMTERNRFIGDIKELYSEAMHFTLDLDKCCGVFPYNMYTREQQKNERDIKAFSSGGSKTVYTEKYVVKGTIFGGPLIKEFYQANSEMDLNAYQAIERTRQPKVTDTSPKGQTRKRHQDYQALYKFDYPSRKPLYYYPPSVKPVPVDNPDNPQGFEDRFGLLSQNEKSLPRNEKSTKLQHGVNNNPHAFSAVNPSSYKFQSNQSQSLLGDPVAWNDHSPSQISGIDNIAVQSGPHLLNDRNDMNDTNKYYYGRDNTQNPDFIVDEAKYGGNADLDGDDEQLNRPSISQHSFPRHSFSQGVQGAYAQQQNYRKRDDNLFKMFKQEGKKYPANYKELAKTLYQHCDDVRCRNRVTLQQLNDYGGKFNGIIGVVGCQGMRSKHFYKGMSKGFFGRGQSRQRMQLDLGEQLFKRVKACSKDAEGAGHQGEPITFILGDNFYDDGLSTNWNFTRYEKAMRDINSNRDKSSNLYRFTRDFSEPYGLMQCFVVLGNHDAYIHTWSCWGEESGKSFASNFMAARKNYFSTPDRTIARELSQVRLTYMEEVNPYMAWNMPYRYYALFSEKADFFVLDSNSFLFDLEQKYYLIDRYKQSLRRDTEARKNKKEPNTKILVLHHPFLAAGKRLNKPEDAVKYQKAFGMHGRVPSKGEIGNMIKDEIFRLNVSEDDNNPKFMRFDIILCAHDHLLSIDSLPMPSTLSEVPLTQVISGGGGGKLSGSKSEKAIECREEIRPYRLTPCGMLSPENPLREEMENLGVQANDPNVEASITLKLGNLPLPKPKPRDFLRKPDLHPYHALNPEESRPNPSTFLKKNAYTANVSSPAKNRANAASNNEFTGKFVNNALDDEFAEDNTNNALNDKITGNDLDDLLNDENAPLSPLIDNTANELLNDELTGDNENAPLKGSAGQATIHAKIKAKKAKKSPNANTMKRHNNADFVMRDIEDELAVIAAAKGKVEEIRFHILDGRAFLEFRYTKPSKQPSKKPSIKIADRNSQSSPIFSKFKALKRMRRYVERNEWDNAKVDIYVVYALVADLALNQVKDKEKALNNDGLFDEKDLNWALRYCGVGGIEHLEQLERSTKALIPQHNIDPNSLNQYMFSGFNIDVATLKGMEKKPAPVEDVVYNEGLTYRSFLKLQWGFHIIDLNNKTIVMYGEDGEPIPLRRGGGGTRLEKATYYFGSAFKNNNFADDAKGKEKLVENWNRHLGAGFKRTHPDIQTLLTDNGSVTCNDLLEKLKAYQSIASNLQLMGKADWISLNITLGSIDTGFERIQLHSRSHDEDDFKAQKYFITFIMNDGSQEQKFLCDVSFWLDPDKDIQAAQEEGALTNDAEFFSNTLANVDDKYKRVDPKWNKNTNNLSGAMNRFINELSLAPISKFNASGSIDLEKEVIIEQQTGIQHKYEVLVNKSSVPVGSFNMECLKLETLNKEDIELLVQIPANFQAWVKLQLKLDDYFSKRISEVRHCLVGDDLEHWSWELYGKIKNYYTIVCNVSGHNMREYI